MIKLSFMEPGWKQLEKRAITYRSYTVGVYRTCGHKTSRDERPQVWSCHVRAHMCKVTSPDTVVLHSRCHPVHVGVSRLENNTCGNLQRKCSTLQFSLYKYKSLQTNFQRISLFNKQTVLSICKARWNLTAVAQIQFWLHMFINSQVPKIGNGNLQSALLLHIILQTHSASNTSTNKERR